MSKKHEEHEEHVNHEAWVIPYADMLTLLFCLFLVLWATQRSDSAKFEQVAAQIRSEFSAANLDGSMGILEGIGPSPVPEANANQQSMGTPPSAETLNKAVEALKAQQEITGAVARERNTLEATEQQIADYLKGTGLADRVGFSLEQRGLVVSILSDKVLFDPGSATLREEAVPLMDAVAGALRSVPNDLIVEGHTDSRPISGGGFASNWELSTARATSVLQYLRGRAGIDGRRLSATGYADTRPIAPNETNEGRARNRRVEIVVVSSFAPAVGAPAPRPTPTTAPVTSPSGTPTLQAPSAGGTTQTPAQTLAPQTIIPELGTGG